MLVDVGTNTEVVVTDGRRVVAASCPAGPAFEGGLVRYGMPASEGAIEAVRHDGGGWVVRTIGDVEPEGICGSGLVDVLAELRRTGTMTPTAAFSGGTSEVTIVPEHGITFSRADAAHLAQAKAANAVGMRVLLRTLDLAPGDLAALHLAGGFASHVDVANAQAIGFLPPVPAERVVQHGNASVRGAATLLLSRARPGPARGLRRPDRARGARGRARLLRPVRRRPAVRAAAVHRGGTARMNPAAKPPLRTRLVETDEFVTVTEIVPSHGLALDPPARRSLEAARALVDDPRIAAISITDNAGGHAMASPVPARRGAAGQGPGRHRPRRLPRSQPQRPPLARAGSSRRAASATSSPCPATTRWRASAACRGPVFDVDSVGLLSLYHDLVNEPGPDGADHAPGLYLGTAVSPFKRLESEVILQYLKLGLKARAGADFVIPQLGYDAASGTSCCAGCGSTGSDLPVLANVYVLTRTVARLFNANAIPGCVVSDELLAAIEKAAAGPDKGKAFFLELAAKQVAIARGMGFRGAYLAGHTLPAADVDRILAHRRDVRPRLAGAGEGGPVQPEGHVLRLPPRPDDRAQHGRARPALRPLAHAGGPGPRAAPRLARLQGEPADPRPRLRAGDAGLPGRRPLLRDGRAGTTSRGPPTSSSTR